MKVILQDDVHNLGSTGDVVEVADGYGRNYLLPRQLAVLADERNSRRLGHQKRQAAAKQARLLTAAKELAGKITGTAITLKRQAASEDKIFGAVTNLDIAEALAAQGITVDRKQIILPEPIRNIGVSQVPIRILKDVEAQVKVYVIRG